MINNYTCVGSLLFAELLLEDSTRVVFLIVCIQFWSFSVKMYEWNDKAGHPSPSISYLSAKQAQDAETTGQGEPITTTERMLLVMGKSHALKFVIRWLHITVCIGQTMSAATWRACEGRAFSTCLHYDAAAARWSLATYCEPQQRLHLQVLELTSNDQGAEFHHHSRICWGR